MASLKGWKIPNNPTLFGPFRNWIYPKILRSNNVKKAILISTINKIIRILKKFINI